MQTFRQRQATYPAAPQYLTLNSQYHNELHAVKLHTGSLMWRTRRFFPRSNHRLGYARKQLPRSSGAFFLLYFSLLSPASYALLFHLINTRFATLTTDRPGNAPPLQRESGKISGIYLTCVDRTLPRTTIYLLPKRECGWLTDAAG